MKLFNIHFPKEVSYLKKASSTASDVRTNAPAAYFHISGMS